MKTILMLDEMPKSCMDCILCYCDRDFDYICSALSTKAKDDFTKDTFMVVSEEECWKVGERYSKCPLTTEEQYIKSIYHILYDVVVKRDQLNKALEEIMESYDAYSFINRYGTREQNSHKEQFEILSQLKGEKAKQALDWIRYRYYYKKDYENGEEKSAFAYLKDRIAEYE